jgi:hypothetical protein
MQGIKRDDHLLTSVLGVSIFGRGEPVEAPQWRRLPTESYPKKRDDIVFADVHTGFYGTGKGNPYRTEDGGQSWRSIWSRPGTLIRALGFIDRKHAFLGNLGAGPVGITDANPLYESIDGGVTWEPAQVVPAAIPGACSTHFSFLEPVS